MALGCVGIILSFMVPDRKKSLISLTIGGVIIFIGLLQFGSQWIQRVRWERRMSQIRSEGNIDWDKMREQMKQKATGTAPAPVMPEAKKK
jgi:cytochrome c biogenesis protein CcdA